MSAAFRSSVRPDVRAGDPPVVRFVTRDGWNSCRYACGLQFATSRLRRKHERSVHEPLARNGLVHLTPSR